MPRGEPEYDLHYHWQLHLRARPAIWILPSLPGGSEGLVTRQEALLEFNRFQQRSTPLLRVREWLQRGCFIFDAKSRQTLLTRPHRSITKAFENSVGVVVVIPAGPVLRVPAVLYGSDLVSSCTVERWPERSSSGRRITRCRITNERPDLPTAPTLLRFPGTSFQHIDSWAISS